MIARILYRQCSFALTDYVFQRVWAAEQAETPDRQPQVIAGPSESEGIAMITKYIGTAGDAVYHVILSAPKGTELEPEQWVMAVDMFLRGMGLSGNPCVAVRHRDTPCDHVHVLVNRYATTSEGKIDRNLWADGDAYARSRDVCREIEWELYRQLRSLDSLRWARYSVPGHAVQPHGAN